MATGKSGYFDMEIATYAAGTAVIRYWWQENYDVEGNYSTITLTQIGVQTAHSVRNGTYYVNATVTADDAAVATLSGNAYSVYSVDYQFNPLAINQTSGKIYHDDATGTKSVTLTATLTGNLFSNDAGWTAGSGTTVSVTVELTTIPRMTEVSAPNGVIGSAVNLSVSRKSTAYTHTLSYTFGDASGTIVSKSTASVVSWTPPLALCSQIPSAASGVCTITCKTYSGSTLIGTKTCTMTLTVPSSVGLVVSDGWAAAAPCNTGAASGFSRYVQGYSRAQVTFDSSKISTANAYGATVASYGVTYGGTAFGSPYRTGVLGSAGSQKLVCTVTDSRGRTVSETLTITVDSYAKPALSGVSVFRCSSGGTAADDGTYLSVTAVGTVSSLGGENTRTMTAAIRTVGGSYGSEKSFSSGVTAVLFDGLVSAVATYEVRLTLTDGVGNTAVVTLVIPTADAFFNGREGGSGAAFGKYAEEDDLLEVAWNLRVRKDAEVDGALSAAELSADAADFLQLKIGGVALWKYLMPVGYVYVSTVSTSPASLFGGTWTQITDRFLLAAGSSYTAGNTGGAATVTLTTSQMPSHAHGPGPYGDKNWVPNDSYSRQYFSPNSSGTYLTLAMDDATDFIWGQTNPTGGGGAHNNMPPYYVVYMWRRTA